MDGKSCEQSPESTHTMVVAEREGDTLPDGDVLTNHDFPVDGDVRRTEGPESVVSVYGTPIDASAAALLCPSGEHGLVYHAQLVSAEWSDSAHCNDKGDIKPRRPILPVRSTDFFSSLVQTTDKRWIFSGVLNGWPGLTTLELLSITYRKHKTLLSKPGVKRAWVKGESTTPSWPTKLKHPLDSVRVTLRLPPWSSFGWSPSSRGFVWWFTAQRKQPLLLYGEDIMKQLKKDSVEEKREEPVCTKIHMFSHRYARPKETNKDKLTYHSALLVEWDHQQYTTVIELATLNGVGGRMGKVNWYHDKMETSPALYKAMATAMILPWKGELAEIRCSDVPAKSLEEFKEYVSMYVGCDKRFLDPHFHLSAYARLSYRSQSDIARYLINYRNRDERYTQEFRNCQTFACDFFSFVCGKKEVSPFAFVNRQGYINRSHLFLYDADLYDNSRRNNTTAVDVTCSVVCSTV